MKYTLVASALAAILAVPLAQADDQSKDMSKDQSTTSQKEDMSQKDQSAKDQSAKDQGQLEPVDVLFDTDSAAIKTDADADIAAAVDWAKCNDKAALILEGHADPRGTQDYNLQLSAQRAAAVRQKLVDQGVRGDRIVITVFGKNGPRRDSFKEDRRVTLRPATVPVEATEVQAMR